MVAVQKFMQYAITVFFLKSNLCFLYTNWFILLLYV